MKYTIKLIERTNLATTCDKVEIEWLTPHDCAVINSISPDGKIIKIEYPEGCTERLIAVVKCVDPCEDCEPVFITIQPCEDDADCPECEECIDGLCVSICPDDKFCDEDTCVECNDQIPCPGDQDCVSGKCVCPPGKKVYKDNCVDCFPNETKEGSCDQCINGAWVPRDCGLLLVDPETCECVDCYNSGHCDAPNECCIKGVCDCCEGYEKDVNGDCVPEPECRYDGECEECETCDEGECVEKVCPDGYECVDDECIEICDCEDPDCTKGNCIDTGLPNCHCFSCEGPCDENSDCGPGCYCDGNRCVDNPCFNYCADGKDCGPGCGCEPETVTCVPCHSIDCDDCDTVDGCGCDDGENCGKKDCFGPCTENRDCGPGCSCDENECVDSDDPCDGDCVDGDDCGPGCGCDEEDCTDCSKVSCAEHSDCPYGCLCGEDKKCKDNPCSTDRCVDGECGTGCGCDEDGYCVPCAMLSCVTGECDQTPGCKCNNEGKCIGDPNPDCKEEVTIEKGDCDLTVSVETDTCCQCSVLGIGYEIKNYSTGAWTPDPSYPAAEWPSKTDFDVEITLRDGEFFNMSGLFANPKIGSLNIENYKRPNHGTIKLHEKVTFRKYYKDGPGVVPNNKIVRTGAIQTVNMATSMLGDTATVSFYTPSITQGVYWGEDDQGREIYIRIVKVEVFARVGASLRFDNDCVYSRKQSLIYTFNSERLPLNGRKSGQKTYKETLCRKPLLKVYNSSDKQAIFDGAPFHQAFGYTYTFKGDGSTVFPPEPLKYYGAEADCGCSEEVVYSCSGGEPNLLVFCAPTKMEYKFNSCGEELEFIEDVIIDCLAYDAWGVFPTYELVLNGVVVDTKTPTTKTLYASASTFSLPGNDRIHTVELRIVEDECNECPLIGNNDYVPLSGGLDMSNNVCGDQTDITYEYTIEGGKPPYTVTIEDPDAHTNTYTHTGEGTFVKTETQPSSPSGDYEFKIEDDDGCTVEETVNYQTIVLSDEILIETICEPSVGIKITNNGSFDVDVYIPSKGNYRVNAGKNAFIVVNAGTHNLEITPIKGGVVMEECTYSTTHEVSCCLTVLEYLIKPMLSGGSVTIYVTNNSTGNIEFTLITNGSPGDTIVVYPGQTDSFTGLDPDNTYKVKVSSVGGVGCPEYEVDVWDSDDYCDNFKTSLLVHKWKPDGEDCSVSVAVHNNLNYLIGIKINGILVESGTTDTLSEFHGYNKVTEVEVYLVDMPGCKAIIGGKLECDKCACEQEAEWQCSTSGTAIGQHIYETMEQGIYNFDFTLIYKDSTKPDLHDSIIAYTFLGVVSKIKDFLVNIYGIANVNVTATSQPKISIYVRDCEEIYDFRIDSPQQGGAGTYFNCCIPLF